MQYTEAQQLAFPGAVGFGQYATGGRAGTVYHVTTLADSGTGSFRDAVSHSGRIIVFDVGGYINLQSAVTCSSSLTIAGETAPGGGIGILGHEVSFSVRNNCIVRYLRFRPGSIAASTEDGINIGDATNMIFDHVSVEFAPYNNIDAHGNNTGGNQITFQYSILADPIGQQFNAHTEALGNTFSWVNNIFSSGHDRNPLAKVNTIFINNVVYNYQAGYTVANTSGNFSHDIINNYFITGPSTSNASDNFFQMDSNQSIYSSGNLLDSDNNGSLGGSGTAPSGVTALGSPWSTLTPGIPILPVATAYHADLSLAGALPHDQVDQNVMNDISSLGASGRMWTSQTSTGLGNNGYGVINGGVAALDSDGDGMPDYWEKAVGLNPNNASDAMTIGADGYANIEEYLHWLAGPHAMTDTNTPVNIDLWQYSTGFTNFSATYLVGNASNGVVSLNSGHIAQFTPAANFSGLGSFQFTSFANDGSRFTNYVSVLMTPITVPQNLVWQGDGVANVWTNGGPANWSNGTNLVAFASGDNVTFDDTGSNTPAINLNGPISAGTVYVIADNQDYTFAGTGNLAGGSSLFKTGAGQLTLNTTNTYSGGTVINEGILQVGDGVSNNGGLTGNVTDNDTLVFATTGTMSSSASISGSGNLTETGPGALALSGTETYNGLTAVNAGALAFTGSLPPGDITNNGTLTLGPSSFQLYANSITGPGNVSTGPTGAMILAGTNLFTGNLTNTSGFLILSNNAAAGSGTIVYVGGFVVAAAGMVITNNLSIPNNAASDLCMMATNSGTATWAGNVVVSGGAQWRPGSDGGTLTFVGTAAEGNHYFIVPRGTVVFASNAVVSSTQAGAAFGRDGSANNRSANVTIRDNAAVTLASCSLGGGDQGGNVTLTLQNSAILNCGANNFDVQNVNRSTANTFIRLNGGTMTVGGFTKTKTSETNSIGFNGGVLKAGQGNVSFLPQFNFTTNAVQAGGAIIDDGGFAITILGQLIHDPALGSTPDGGLIKQGAGTLTLNDLNSYNGPTVVAAGTLALGGATVANPLAATTNIFVASGATLDVTAESPYSLAVGRKLWGNGAVTGNFTVGGSAILAPGSNSLGTLTFNGSLSLAAGSTNIFKVSHALQSNDTVVVGGSLTNGGTLIITNINGAQLAAGDSFRLFSAGSYAGNFGTVILPPLPVGLAWNTSTLNTSGTLSVLLATTPVFSGISVSGNNLALSGSGGVGNARYILLGTTNLSTPMTNWTPLFTNQFDSSGNFNFTTNSDDSLPQDFYRLQLQ